MGRGVFEILASALLFALIPIVARAVYATGVDPLSLVVWRMGFAAIIAALACRARRQRLALPRPLWRPAAFAGISYAGMSVTFFLACRYIEAGIANAVFHLAPVIVVAVSVAVGRIRITPGVMLAVVLAVLGLALASGYRGESLSSAGVSLALVAAVFSALYSLAVAARGLREVDPFVLVLYACAATGILAFALGLTQPEWRLAVNAAGIGGAFVLATLCTVVALGCFVRGTQKLGPSLASMLGNVEVAFTVIAGWALLGEKVTVLALLGYGAIVVACAIMGALQAGAGDDEKSGDAF